MRQIRRRSMRNAAAPPAMIISSGTAIAYRHMISVGSDAPAPVPTRVSVLTDPKQHAATATNPVATSDDPAAAGFAPATLSATRYNSVPRRMTSAIVK